jgi:hypothetical protein
MVPRVGQADVSDGVEVNDGTNARSDIPAAVKASAQSVTSIPSGFVNRIVRTTSQLRTSDTERPSLGFASNHVLTVCR